MMTYEQFRTKKRRLKKIKRLSVVVICLALVVAVLWLAIGGLVHLVKAAFATKPEQPKGESVTLEQLDTPTPTATPVPIEGLNRRDPKEGHRLVLEVKASYESVTDVNVRANPWKTAGLVDKINVGDKFDISCVYTDPDNRDFYGFYGAELNVGGKVVWIYKQYCDIHEETEPWAVHTIEAEYSKKYGRSKVTIRSTDGNADANVRSEPRESENSSYGRIRVNATFVASTVYVTSDKQWYGFPAAALNDYVLNVNMDPDGIVWIYSPYCIIDLQ